MIMLLSFLTSWIEAAFNIAHSVYFYELPSLRDPVFFWGGRPVALKSYQEEAGHLSLSSDYIFIEMLLNKYECSYLIGSCLSYNCSLPIHIHDQSVSDICAVYLDLCVNFFQLSL